MGEKRVLFLEGRVFGEDIKYDEFPPSRIEREKKDESKERRWCVD